MIGGCVSIFNLIVTRNNLIVGGVELVCDASENQIHLLVENRMSLVCCVISGEFDKIIFAVMYCVKPCVHGASGASTYGLGGSG